MKLEVPLGLGYMVMSVCCGVYYVTLVKNGFANDLWWTGYNLTGHEAFLVDIGNKMLSPGLASGASIDILGPEATMLKSYTSPVASSKVYPTYARQLVLDELRSLEYAVTNLRTLAPAWALRMNTHHCWVDFAKKLEIAKTDKRQARCEAKYSANAAVYFEATLRNQVWSDFVGFFGGPGKSFTIGLLDPLLALEEGRTWLAQTTTALVTTSVEDEVAYWVKAGVTHFQLQWQDRTATGISESIKLENALGMVHSLSIKSVPNGAGPWSSGSMYWQPLNDLWAMWTFNRSLIRQSSNWFGKNTTLYSVEFINGNSKVGGVFNPSPAKLFNNAIGPFLSVDVFFVSPPPEVMAVYKALGAVVAKTITTSPAGFQAYQSLLAAATSVTPTPVMWQDPNLLFWGGCPMCTLNGHTTYIQETIGFYDTCASITPLTVPLTLPEGLLFALMFGSPSATDVCALSSSNVPKCLAILEDAAQFSLNVQVSDSTKALLAPATAAIRRVNPSFMQFTTNATQDNWAVLTQPIVDDTPAWSFYGYVMVYDWALGRREVLKIDGDEMTMTLMSSVLAPQTFPTSGGDRYIETATAVIVYLITSTSAMLASVAVLCLLYASPAIKGRNLFFFNRVVGATWVGRPLCYLRGISAVCLLSSAGINLVASQGVTRFEMAPRFFIDSIIVAGEATWITYGLNDLMVVFDPTTVRRVGPFCSCVAWLVFLILDLAAPVTPSTSISRTCSSTNMDFAVSCASAVITTGSFPRVVLIVGLQVGIVLVGYVVGRVLLKPSTEASASRNILLSGAANAFLTALLSTTKDAAAHVTLDSVACVLTGLLPLKFRQDHYLFDVPLWIFLKNDKPIANGVSLKNLDESAATQRLPSIASLRSASCTVRSKRKAATIAWLSAIGGFAYILASIAGSVSYVQVSAVNLVNNVFWANFNMTGAGAFLGNWINEQVVLGVDNASVELQSTGVLLPAYFGSAKAQVSSPANFAAAMQHTTLNTVRDTIRGLRTTDACETPWIFTAYCYVDFEKRWEVAHSSARQARCQASMTTNGAVFVEAVLRNVDWAAWSQCWGSAFDVAIGETVGQTEPGRTFLATLTTTAPEQDEIQYWAKHKIATFDVQWQNYKRLGLINTYGIRNAYGIEYSITLQSQNGTYRFGQETSRKMYWGWASDLVAVGKNSSGIGGMSLVRGSANYAFANTSLQDVLVTNGTLNSPLPEPFRMLASLFLGPFGTVDMEYVSVPPQLSSFIVDLLASVRSKMATSKPAQLAYFNMTPVVTAYPLPLAWITPQLLGYGASPLCPGASRSAGLKLKGARQLFSFDAPCSSGPSVAALLYPTRDAYVFMATMARLPSLAAVCPNDPFNIGSCVNGYPLRIEHFMQNHMPPVSASAVASLATQIQAMNIESMIWATLNSTSPLLFLHTNVLDAADPTYAFFGWNYIFDWAMGQREIVRFAGDVGAITLVSEVQTALSQEVLAWQLPGNVASYFRGGVLYVTFIMILVAIFAGSYIIAAQGHVQGLNMLELARVGGHVWVGRPFLFLRSITALTLLSTSALQLQYSGHVSTLSLEAIPWYKTLLAASEVTWLVAVVNDVMMVVTQSYTATYVTLNSLLVWAIVAAVTAASPVQPETTIARDCVLASVDFQIVCTSATITIGQPVRFWTLVGIILGCNLLCYVVAKWCWFRGKPPSCEANSLFLSSGAKYLFVHSNRKSDDVYFLDRASAAINGILTVWYGGNIHMVDLKLWRYVVVREPRMEDIPADEPNAAAWRNAVPLTE